MTDLVSRTAARRFGVAAILLGGLLLGFTGCGSVTAKKSDGGTGGSPTDSSTKMDVAADSAKDMRVADARTTDASSQGGSGGVGAGSGGRGGGGGGRDGTGGSSGGTGGSGSGSGGSSGGSGGSGGAGGGSGGSGSGGSGSGGAGGGGECKTNGDCTLYSGAGSGCCGVCQPASDPAPPPIECLLACSSLLTVKTCGCVNNQCVGKTTQL